MLTYIARRMLLMIPTLLGMTLLIFMLVALSPGGLTASALAAAGGGSPSGADPRVADARFRDRFSLDDPVLVQYGRWLGRMSPVKIGPQALIASTGDRIYPPRPLPVLPVPPWATAATGLSDALPQAEASGAASYRPAEDATERRQQFLRLQRAAAEARDEFVGRRAAAMTVLGDYALAIGRSGAVDSIGFIRPGEVASLPAAPERPQFAAAQAALTAAAKAWCEAASARAMLEVAFESRPYPAAGWAIIPGVLSVGAPDLGWSRSRNRPVASLIMEALPVTLLLNLVAFPIIYLVAIPTGMLAASRRGSWFDVLTGGLFVALWSVPVVWAATLAVGFLANSQNLGWFPVAGLHDKRAEDFLFLPTWGSGGFEPGWLLDTLWHMVLPVACLIYTGFAVLSRQTRAAMLDNFNADYVRTAKAKGVPRRDVVFRHVFRNSLLPLITMFVSIFPGMLSGAVVVERVFSIPGMGSLMLDAISLRDAEIILANATIVGFVTLLALLLADILYAAADPRVTYG